MSAPIPRPALALGLAGVLPFAALCVLPLFSDAPRVIEMGDALLTLYAITILAFMSGCIWAFAAKQDDVTGYALSTLPALFGWLSPFLPVFLGWITPAEALLLLAAGFVVLLALDRRAVRLAQAPDWWLKLRVLLTALVVGCLLIGSVL